MAGKTLGCPFGWGKDARGVYHFVLPRRPGHSEFSRLLCYSVVYASTYIDDARFPPWQGNVCKSCRLRLRDLSWTQEKASAARRSP